MLLYPAVAILLLFYWSTLVTRRWMTACIVGLVVFVALMALLPADLAILDVGSRVARPLCAYLGGFVTTSIIVMLSRHTQTT